jgi:hypothetical protein
MPPLWRRLNLLGFKERLFVVVSDCWGYIDESKDSEWFTLSSLLTNGETWTWVELAWDKCLEEKNTELKAAGRRELSRYHASDCSSLVGEFLGWNKSEQIEFTGKLLSVFRRHVLNIVAYSLNLKELVEEIPDTKADPQGFAYTLLLKYLMLEIGQRVSEYKSQPVVTLIHDRCDWNTALLESFDFMMGDPTFKYKKYFSTLTSQCWQHCVPLQPADLIAYENFKEAQRAAVGRKRRKSLELILDLDSIGGTARALNRDNLRELRELMDERTSEILQIQQKRR